MTTFWRCGKKPSCDPFSLAKTASAAENWRLAIGSNDTSIGIDNNPPITRPSNPPNKSRARRSELIEALDRELVRALRGLDYEFGASWRIVPWAGGSARVIGVVGRLKSRTGCRI